MHIAILNLAWNFVIPRITIYYEPPGKESWLNSASGTLPERLFPNWIRTAKAS
jgi:hypothetical protein